MLAIPHPAVLERDIVEFADAVPCGGRRLF